MAKETIIGEERFKSIGDCFAVAPTESGYTLAYSADGVHFTQYDEATPAGENLIVNGCVPFMWFKLVGNTGEAVIMK